MELAQRLYFTELTALKDANSLLRRQQSEASSENAAILQKQAELSRELSTLQDTKTEAMELCRHYEKMYGEERERRQADRELIRSMRAQWMSENKMAAAEANAIRKQLSEEKRATMRLGAENRSLKAQVSFLEQKLRDMERGRDPLTRTSFLAQPHSARPSLSHTAAPEHHSQTEFDTSTHVGVDVLTSDLRHNLTARDAGTINFTFPGPQFHSTAVKPPQDTTQSHPSQVAVVVETGQVDDKERISELKSRNRRVLPHLKSSYAVELQEKWEDPCIFPGEKTGRPQRKRAVGNSSSVWLTSSVAPEGSRKRGSGERKAAGDLGSSGSPASSRRRISDPTHTPRKPLCEPSLTREGESSMRQDPRRATLDAGYSLRGHSVRDENRPSIEARDEAPPAAMFEMAISPPSRPDRLSELPERLRKRLEKQDKLAKPVSTATTATTGGGRKRKSAVVGKPSHTTTKRTALKTKN
jgi:hypothetical protein